MYSEKTPAAFAAAPAWLPRRSRYDEFERQPPGKARILYFDDNGYYTLPSLLILESLMSRVGTVGDGKDTRPCEYFDLICGVGFGGIIALLLGRLGMTTAQCQKWFQEHCNNLLPIGQAGMVTGTGRNLQANNNALEIAFKAALKIVGLPEDTSLLDPNHTGLGGSLSSPHTCRVFVLAMHPGDIHVPVRLRSYSSRMDPNPPEFSLWETAVATEASPTFYTPVTMGQPPLPYISSALGYCNPGKEALDEAVRIWKISGIQCLVSLGTGKKPPRLELEDIPTKSIGLLQLNKGLSLINTLSAIATDTQRVHIEMTRDANLLGLKYFRFEATEGVTYKSSYDRSFLGKVHTSVFRYLHLEETLKTLAFCAEHLQTGEYPSPEHMKELDRLSRITSSSSVIRSPNMPSLKDGRELSKELIGLSINASRRQESPSSAHRTPSANPGLPIVDSEFIPPIKEQANAELSADAWIQLLRKRVHPLVQQRRRDNDRRVKIAILDSGLDQQHPDILRLATQDGTSRIKEVKDWTSSVSGTEDDSGHGTFCAALLLELAPNADIYIAKVFDSRLAKASTADHVAEAISHAATTWKVDIIAMAFGFQQRQESILKVIRLAYDKGVIMIAAASNDGALESRSAFPARLDQVICMYSADGHGASSSFNPLPGHAEDNFTILGEKVESADLGSQRTRKSGTSVATMVAAGVAALVLELSFQRPTRIRESDIRSYSGIRAIFSTMSRDTATFTPDGRYFIRPWKLLDPEKDLDYVLMDISYILDRL